MLKKIREKFAEAKHFLLYGFLNSVSKAFGAIFPLIIAKFFAPELFASYSLAKTLVFFVAAMTISSIQRPFIVFANQELLQTGKIAKTFTIKILFVIASLIVGAVLTIIFAGPISRFAQISRADLPAVYLGFAGFTGCCVISNLFLGLNRRICSVLADLFFNVFSTAIVIVLYLFNAITIKSVFMVNLYAMAGVFICMGGFIDYKKLLPFKFDFGYMRQMSDFAKWIFLGVTASYFVSWGDNLVLRCYVSMDNIGVYNFAYQISKTIIFLTATIYFYFLPFVVQNIRNREKIDSYLSIKRPKIFVAGFAGLAIAYFLLPYLIGLVYGDTYKKSDIIFKILLLGNLFNLYVIFLPGVFEALKRYKSLNIITIIQVAINLLLDLAFVPRWGIKGAAVATVIGYFSATVIMEIYFRRCVFKELKND
jgi:O-antigen/teichoic acid export membrane protein